MATVNHNRNGQLACIKAVEARMDDLERAIIISGVGAPQFENARLNLTALRLVTQEMRMPIGEAPATADRCDHKFVDSNHCLKCGWTPPPATPSLINNEERDRARGVMRPPKYRGD